MGKITIVGTGLLGASLGLGLRATGYGGKIVGVGRRMVTVERARALGCVDTATTDLGRAVAASQLVVLATPLGAFPGLFGHLAKHDHEDLVITDVGSTKQQVCADAERLLAHPERFVGSHPMAGSEQHGPDHARADLFTARPCIVTPQDQTGAGALELVEALWSKLGMKLIRMAPAEHDCKIACISHLPHALAMQLVSLATRHQALDVASSGFRDTTRIASGDPQVWAQIFTTNRSEVIRAIDAFSRELGEFRDKLVRQEDEHLVEHLRRCKEQRDGWISRIGETTG